MGINSQAALDAINQPLPFATDLVEAMAMRLWQNLGSLPGNEWFDSGMDFHEIPGFLQEDLRDAARAQLARVVGAIDVQQGPATIFNRLEELHEYALAHDDDAPGESGEVAHKKSIRVRKAAFIAVELNRVDGGSAQLILVLRNAQNEPFAVALLTPETSGALMGALGEVAHPAPSGEVAP